MLMAIGEELPTRGLWPWLVNRRRGKMSKSKGNVVDPVALINDLVLMPFVISC